MKSLILVGAALTLTGCISVDSCSDGPNKLEYAIQTLNATGFSQTHGPFNTQEAGDIVPSDFIISIDGSAENLELSSRFNINFSLLPKAYACSLLPLFESNIDNIRVFIRTADTSTLQSGTEVTDEFLVSSWHKNIDGFSALNEWNKQPTNLFNLGNTLFTAAKLRFKSPETILDGHYSYDLMVTLENGDMFHFSTNEVSLKQP